MRNDFKPYHSGHGTSVPLRHLPCATYHFGIRTDILYYSFTVKFELACIAQSSPSECNGSMNQSITSSHASTPLYSVHYMCRPIQAVTALLPLLYALPGWTAGAMCTWPSALAPVAKPGMGNEEAKASTFFLISGRRGSVSMTLRQAVH